LNLSLFSIRIAAIVSVVLVTLLVYLFTVNLSWRKVYVTRQNGKTLVFPPNYPLHPSIWMIGMLNQQTSVSLCDYKKTILANQMFWNELLFDEQVWIIDAQPESIRRVRTGYQYIYPYPKFYPLKPPANISQRMKRINDHTRMRTPAYELQQWSTFYFDVYAEAIAKMYSIPQPEIIAIVDADSQLQTFPTFESIFPESNFYDIDSLNKSTDSKSRQFKLRAFGLGLDMFSEATQLLLGKPQVADFMVTFPVYLYLNTMRNLRNYVEKLHNMSFDDAFEKCMIKSRTYYSQFAILLSYAYWFEHEHYSFHIQPWPGNELNEFYSRLVPHSVPQPRIAIHIKNTPKQAIIKGCCFSYQLNNSVTNDSVYQQLDQQDRAKMRDLCNSFGNYENHYEATCEDLHAPTTDGMHIWKHNDTMTKHYKNAARDIQYLSNASKNRKMMACIHYLSDPDAQLWFPQSDSGCKFLA
jgi:hypothetical protein